MIIGKVGLLFNNPYLLLCRTPYRFLKPEIIATIAEDNEKQSKIWKNALIEKGINPELYLWNNSPCTFPGVRRHAGSKEIASHRGHTNLDDVGIRQALKLDDNDFPKQIWSFIFRGKKFAKFGPKEYALAHLVDHKEYNNRMMDEFSYENGKTFSDPLYGLYTCPSNTIYIPANIIKPTDFSGNLRQLLFRKMVELYKDSCNVLPPDIKIPQNINKEWEVSCFDWAEPVGDIKNIEIFLEYRKNIIDGLIYG